MIKNKKNFNEKKIELDNLMLCLQDFLKLINSLNSVSSHATIYKCYLLAAQIIFSMSNFLHCRVNYLKKFRLNLKNFQVSKFKGKSDTLFAKIIDKMILAFGITKSTNNSKISSVSQANNFNSVLISLKDTLHMVTNLR